MSYIPVRLGDLVKHNIPDYGIGLVVGYDRIFPAFLTVQWLQHPSQHRWEASYSPKTIHTVKTAREQKEA